MKEMYDIKDEARNKDYLELSDIKKVFVIEEDNKVIAVFNTKKEALFYENFKLSFEEFYERYNILKNFRMFGENFNLTFEFQKDVFELRYFSRIYTISFTIKNIIDLDGKKDISIILNLDSLKNNYMMKHRKMFINFYNKLKISYDEFLRVKDLYNFQK